MPRIFIADMLDGAATLRRILKGHDCTVVTALAEAEAKLKEETFDLIIAGLHFDDSQMFELIREVKKSPKNAGKPIICFCSRDTKMSRLAHESLEHSTKALGAWMYLAEHLYNVYQDPDAELRRIMERCLSDESRKDIQLQRLDIERRREELQQLRILLEAEEWSADTQGHLGDLTDDLELLLDEVKRLHSAAASQRASVSNSRELQDRVADRVSTNENVMTGSEDTQTVAEDKQSVGEKQQTAKEDIKEAEGQRKQRKKTEER